MMANKKFIILDVNEFVEITHLLTVFNLGNDGQHLCVSLSLSRLFTALIVLVSIDFTAMSAYNVVYVVRDSQLFQLVCGRSN
jgi:hypothetical protein